MDGEIEIDATGLKCPLPVLKLGRRLRAAPEGAVLRLLATDPMAAIDVPHFCTEGGHDYLGAEAAGPATAYRVRKGGER
jgi:tRNA 2-thiouridine synthesizing protein A